MQVATELAPEAADHEPAGQTAQVAAELAPDAGE